MKGTTVRASRAPITGPDLYIPLLHPSCPISHSARPPPPPGPAVTCIATYRKLLKRVAGDRMTHRTIHTCHSNQAAAYLKLSLFSEALDAASRAVASARLAVVRDPKAADAAAKALSRKGQALLGLDMPKQVR